jgi:hypothetical protein
MKKIEVNHENLADDKLKAKKVWKKPELKVLGINKTNQNFGGSANDGGSYNNATGSV